MVIIDNKILHVYGFNFTGLDISKSRSFGVVTRDKRLVGEAMKLFEADFERQPYTPGYNRFIVSPENARDRLARFIKGARRELLIYDPKVSDDSILRLITERLRAGVDVRVIGKVEAKWDVPFEKYEGKRLHIRAIIRDGDRAFLGSQSLRRIELEKRREVGIVVTDHSVVREMQAIFEHDWAETDGAKKAIKKAEKKAEKREEKQLARAS
jgi:phosphatidylserine/phosphatidylglycerophosphate/cardiolipin synthase-like enzyme